MNAMLRGLFSLAFIGVVFAGAIIILFPAPCALPIAYSIGNLDPRFGLSQETFLKDIEQAEQRWEQVAGKQLFIYNPSASFTINLTYDERQALVDRAKTISQSLDKTLQGRNAIVRQYQDARAVYDGALNLYNRHQQDYDKASINHDNLVQRHNSSAASGNFSSVMYDSVRESAVKLSRQWQNLEDERSALNILAKKVNGLANTESKVVQTYNSTVKTFNTEFSDEKEFDQGEYTGNAITVYEFAKHNDLLLVLTHEMGHALGIEHVQDPSAVMYYMVNAKNLAGKGLTSDDISALRTQCSKNPFQVFWERLTMLASGAKKGV